MENPPQPAPPDAVDDLRVTYIGHATALIQVAGLNLLTDPFFSWRASPVQWAGPKRVRAPGLALEDLPRIDAVLVSHNHYDHMDLPSLRRLFDRHRPRIVTPLGNGAIVARTRRPLDVTEGDWGDRVALGDGVAATFAPALHWSKRGLHDRNMALWSAFVIETPAGTVYFAGDTGYGSGAHFRDIRREFGPVRLALLPIGAYEPRWFMHPQHMNPEEAVKAHLDLAAGLSIGVHHATVQLTDEAIDEPAAAPQQDFSAFDMYLRGRYYWNMRTEEGMKRSLQYFGEDGQRIECGIRRHHAIGRRHARHAQHVAGPRRLVSMRRRSEGRRRESRMSGTRPARG